MTKTILRWIMALFYVAAGANHVLRPQLYLELMPPYLPWHLELVYLSGAAEIALGCGVLVPRFRRFSGWGLIALLIAVFPANINAAIHHFRAVPDWILLGRLPLQLRKRHADHLAAALDCVLDELRSHSVHTRNGMTATRRVGLEQGAAVPSPTLRA